RAAVVLERLEDRALPSFVVPLSFDVGRSPRFTAVGEFNGDNVPDLAVANWGADSTTVSVLLGNGAGTFQAARNFPGGIGVPAVGDFNGDGRQDLAISDQRNNSVSVLLGNGNGTFQAPRAFAAGQSPSFLAIGDFNGDRVQDLAVTKIDVYPN